MPVAMRRLRARCDRGSVLVLTAAAMFPIAAMLTFTIDVSHWFDYSRNLQNRADAAALAGGSAFGNICLSGGTPGPVLPPSPQTGTGQYVIGEYAQLYSGAGTRSAPNLATANLPYTDQQVIDGTNWDVTTNGYLNNTTTNLVPSPLTLKLGSLNDYWVVLNGNDYSENGGTSFSMNAAGSGATFCNSDPKYDLTDPARASAGDAGPMVDVKVSQKQLPNFIPLFNLKPTIHAHARVQLQGEASAPTEPIAVSDSGYAGCVTVYYKSTADDSTLATVNLTRTSTNPITWTGGVGVPMPANANVYVQAYLSNCTGTGITYDLDTTTGQNSGVLLLNSYGNSSPGPGEPPQITTVGSTGGVTLTNGSCSSPAGDPFFTVAPANGSCNVSVTAYVKFNTAPGNNCQNACVFATDTSVPGSELQLTAAGGTTWTPKGNGTFTIGDESGVHPITLRWEQYTGTVNGQTCGNGNGTNPPPCKGPFPGVQAQAFGACNGCDAPDASGPIILAQVRTTSDPVGSFGPNAYAQGTTPNLVVTLELAGLSTAAPTDPPVVLRFPTSGNHQTGLVDCGQGTGANGDSAVVYYGCGPNNPQVPGLNPLYIYGRTGVTLADYCSPFQDGNSTDWPGGNHQDCVKTTPGSRRVAIICNLVLRITGEPYGTNCNSQNNLSTCDPLNPTKPCCPPNYWNANNGVISGADPRAVTMVITAPADFASADNAPQYWLPIRRFATFYITGWDKNINPQCSGTGPNDPLANDPYPGRGKLKNQQNAAVWGHWMNYTDSSGIGNGQACVTSTGEPVNCVPVLTR